MTATPLLHNSAIRFLRQEGIAFNMPSDRVIVSQVAVSDEMRPLNFVIIDISKSVAAGDGFMLVVPDLITFKDGYDEDAVFVATDLNHALLLGGEVGKFTVINRTLVFALETVVPKNSAAPEQFEVALRCAVDVVMKLLHTVAQEALKRAADDDDRGLGDDWDIRDILNA